MSKDMTGWAEDIRALIEEAEQYGAVFYFQSECSISCCRSLRVRIESTPSDNDPILWSNKND